MSSHHSALLERLPAAHARCAAHLRARRQRDTGAKCPRPIAHSTRRRLLRPWSHLLDLIAGVPICALACVVRPNLMLEPSSLAGQCIIDPHAWPNAQKKQQEKLWSIDFSTRTSGAPAGVVGGDGQGDEPARCRSSRSSAARSPSLTGTRSTNYSRAPQPTDACLPPERRPPAASLSRPNHRPMLVRRRTAALTLLLPRR